MSSNIDDSDSSARVVRRSLRRMASNESLTEIESRLDTPINRQKKLNTIVEKGTTSIKKTLIAIDSPRRTRKISEESNASISSPLRRVTRASSQDKDVSASPLPARTSRRSALADSESEDVNTPGTAKNLRNKRKSTIMSLTVDQIEEEDEGEGEGENKVEDIQDNVFNGSKDELELRNRSISKSPSVSSSPPKGMNNNSFNGSKSINFSVLDSTQGEEVLPPKKFFKSQDIQDAPKQSKMDFEDDEDLPPIEKYLGSKRVAQPTKLSYEEILQKAAKNVEHQFEIGTAGETLNKSAEQKVHSAKNTPVRGRRSIHDGQESGDEKLYDMLNDFVDDESRDQSPEKKAETPNRRVKTPKSTSKAQTAIGTLKQASKENGGEDNDVQVRGMTPKSAKKVSEASPKTPKRNSLTGESTLENIGTEITVKTPKSAGKKVETPKSAKKASLTPGKSPKLNDSHDVDMEISEKEVDRNGSVNDSEDMELTPMERAKSARKPLTGISLSASKCEKRESPQVDKSRKSLQSYIESVAKSSLRLFNKSRLVDDDNIVSPKKANRSWGVAVSKSAQEPIDGSAVKSSPVVIKSADQRVKGYSSDEDEEEMEEKNSFVNGECEVGDEESITASELNYMKENEIPDDGESLGSEDSRDDEDGEDLDEDGDESDEADSFIDEDEDISDQYELDTDEDEVEKSHDKPKRKSRIIQQSSSEDDENGVEDKVKSPKAHPKSSENGEPSSDEENEAPVVVVDHKSKRKRDDSDQDPRIIVKTKRAKMSNDTANESQFLKNLSSVADLYPSGSDNDSSSDSDNEPEEKAVKKPKKHAPKSEDFNIEKVRSKCDAYMSGYTEEKKANLAKKRERKAQKLALKKQQEAEEVKAAKETLDSSNGSNKENFTKKKNKSKVKKQKPVSEMQEKKDDMAAAVSKQQEKLELKRQRKQEKKMAKKLKEVEEMRDAVRDLNDSNEAAKAAAKSSETDKKALKEVAVEADHPMVEKTKSKKKKSHDEKIHENTTNLIRSALKESQRHIVEVPSKKKKKRVLVDEENVVIEVEETKKKKRGQVEEENVAVEVAETKKKSKKRKLDDSTEANAQPKKKLNVLMQIENPGRYQATVREINQPKEDDVVLAVPLMSKKLKKVIPETVEIEKKKRKKNKRQAVPEPRRSLPRPVWTASGVFIEEPVSPFKFTSTTYVPLESSASCSTKFDVVAFEGKKKKKTTQSQPAADFKSQAMFRNMKNRDGSDKNLRGLLGKQQTF